MRKEALYVKVGGKNIAEVSEMSIEELREWIAEVPKEMTTKEMAIAREILKEIGDRLGFLCDVGLGYLSLSRPSRSLSGGESQRVKLASYLAREFTDKRMMFIFDEPTTGLHIHDINRLLKAFNALITAGHTVVIVEHNMEVIKCADHVIDLGPEAGSEGGEVVVAGTPEEVMACERSYTGQYLKLHNATK